MSMFQSLSQKKFVDKREEEPEIQIVSKIVTMLPAMKSDNVGTDFSVGVNDGHIQQFVISSHQDEEMALPVPTNFANVFASFCH